MKAKLGRPRIGEEGKTLKARKPWTAKKMGRSTWYSRQAERRAKRQERVNGHNSPR